MSSQTGKHSFGNILFFFFVFTTCNTRIAHNSFLWPREHVALTFIKLSIVINNPRIQNKLLQKLSSFCMAMIDKEIVYLDTTVIFNEHLNKTIPYCLHKLKQFFIVNRIKHLLDRKTLLVLKNTFLVSCCNAQLSGAIPSKTNIKRSKQKVHNTSRLWKIEKLGNQPLKN